MRILATYGLSLLAIAQHVQFSDRTVKNIIERNAYPDDDESKDYDFIDETFKALYPPLSASGGKTELVGQEKKVKLEAVSGDMSELPTITIKRVTVTPRSTKNTPPKRNKKVLTSSSHVHSTSRSQTGYTDTSISSPGVSTKQPIVTYQSRSKANYSGSRDDPIKLGFDTPEVSEEPLHPVVEFLSKLDHDISGIFDALNTQGLGTLDQLFAIASWPEETLHQLFKEALPGISVTQRFVLVKGLKKRALEM
ncbi:hypothetical protein BDZ94DRAFT_595236 [Collybia nuda]|uniref:Uncharacterized protein n=1 Tax=Collybia nuda TaxID=64659 RepID=A0A9P6CF83_9AGAR|nr:hypothetical protein BDZ94DRAFT_595236 [Collybia nuda]